MFRGICSVENEGKENVWLFSLLVQVKRSCWLSWVTMFIFFLNIILSIQEWKSSCFMKFQFQVKPWGDVLLLTDFTLSLENLKCKLYVLLLHMSNMKAAAFGSTFVPQRPESAASARQVAVHHSSQPVHTFGSRIILSLSFLQSHSPQFTIAFLFQAMRVLGLPGHLGCLLLCNWWWLPITAWEKREGLAGQGCCGSRSQCPGNTSAWEMRTVSTLLCLGILPGCNWHFTLKNSVIN